ncbi:MAG TPA: hypothetical protein VM756_10540, partial [Burkholderiales bacterium]|nr:hypothetical protein [Burkholderiales bacterium]
MLNVTWICTMPLADEVEHVHGHVVGDEHAVVPPFGRIEGEHLQERRGALLHRHALAAHLERQARLGLLDAVVDVQRRLVGVGADVERDLDLHHALRGGGRGHVD